MLAYISTNASSCYKIIMQLYSSLINIWYVTDLGYFGDLIGVYKLRVIENFYLCSKILFIW